MHVEAELDIADALDLDQAARPRRRGAEGARVDRVPSTYARAKALGDLARTQTALDLSSLEGKHRTTSDHGPVCRRA